MEPIDDLYGRYSDTGDLELCATPRSIQEFAGCLTSGWSPIQLTPLQIEQAAPYDGWLEVIDISVNGDAVVVKRDDLTLTICGSTEKLAILTENLQWLANKVAETGFAEHLHIEYYPDHFYLDEKSEPLVVYVKV